MESRIIAVANAKSTNGAKFQREVYGPLVAGVGEANVLLYAIDKPFEQTTAELTELIRDGDMVLACGGDGTISSVVNACMQSIAEHKLGLIGLGRANDAATDLTGKDTNPLRILEAQTFAVRPLEVTVNGLHAIYAAQHIMAGQAAALAAFLDEKARQKHGNPLFASVLSGVPQFIQFYRQAWHDVDSEFPVPFSWNGKQSKINCMGFSLGSMGGAWRLKVKGSNGSDLHNSENEFAVGGFRANGTLRDIALPARWVISGPPFTRTTFEEISFDEPQKIRLGIDGEPHDFTDVTTCTIARAEKPLHILSPRLTEQTQRKS